MNNSKIWGHVDGIVLINLDQRKDRLSHALGQLNAFVPSEKVNRVSAVDGKTIKGFGKKPWFRNRKKDHKWAGRAGCTLSHRKALDLAISRKWKTTLILEDDFVCLSQDLYLWDSIADAIFNNNKEWELMYLGFTTPSGPTRKIADVDRYRTINQIQGAKTTHAYLVKSDFAKWILSKLPMEKNVWHWCSQKRVIDRWYSRNLSKKSNIYCVSPSLLVQSNNDSDIAGPKKEFNVNNDFIWEIPNYMQCQSFYLLRKFSFITKSWLTEMLESISGYFKRFIGF